MINTDSSSCHHLHGVFAAHTRSVANGVFPAVPMRSKWTPLSHSKYSCILCPDKIWKDRPPHAVPSLHSEVRALANHSLSSFRFLGVSDTRPLCLQAPEYIGKILQVISSKAAFLGLIWGGKPSQYTDSTPKSPLLKCHFLPLICSNLFIRRVIGYQLRVTKPVSAHVSPNLVGLHLTLDYRPKGLVRGPCQNWDRNNPLLYTCYDRFYPFQ